MTRTPNSLREINPVMARAEVRRTEWEARDQSFWHRKRYDNLDLIILIGGIASATIGLIGLVGLLLG